LFDLKGNLSSARGLLLAAHELADHLVDRGCVRDGAGKLDCFSDAMGVLGVVSVIARDKDDVGAELLGFADLGSGFDAKGLGLVAGGDAAGGVGHGGDDGEGPTSVLRVQLLFYRREEAVQVDVQEAEAVGMESVGQGTVFSDYIRFLFAFNHVVGDAKRVAKVQRILVFAKNDAAVFHQELPGRFDVLDGKAWNRRLRVQVTVYVEKKVSGIVFEICFGLGQQTEFHHVGVEVLRCSDVFEVDGNAVVGPEH
jgi:hypothetical protein